MTRRLLLRLLAPIAGPGRFTLLVALAFGITALGVLAVPRSAFGWDDDSFSTGSETTLIAMQNEARASAGLRSLKEDPALRAIARWRSKDMVDRGYFSHLVRGTDRKVFWYMEHTFGYCFRLAGENIGTVTWKGASEDDATKWVFDKFMTSSEHRENILGRTWDVVAVGAYKTSGDTFVWTAIFADSCDSGAPAASREPAPGPTGTSTPGTPATPAIPGPASTPIRTPRPAASSDRVPPGQLRIVDPPAPGGLVDSILHAVTARFFGS